MSLLRQIVENFISEDAEEFFITEIEKDRSPGQERSVGRINKQALHLAQQALKRGQGSKDLARIARTSDRLGRHETDALMKAADLIAKHETRMASQGDNRQQRRNSPGVREDDSPHVNRLYDTQQKEWVGKPTTNRGALTRKADRLDNEYGAVRYVVRPYKD